MNDPERRRIAHAFVARYQASHAGQTVWMVSALRGFSRTGTRLVFEQPIRVGEDLNLQLLLPLAKEPVWVRARVVASRPVTRQALDLEVKFQFGPADTQHEIHAAAALLEQYVKGSGQERRRFHRVTQPFSAQCRLCGAMGDTWHQVAIRDLSAGGMNFESNTALEPDALVELKLQLPNAASPTMIRARVVRIRVRAAGQIEHAVEFVDVKPDQAVQIDALVHFLEKPS